MFIEIVLNYYSNFSRLSSSFPSYESLHYVQLFRYSQDYKGCSFALPINVPFPALMSLARTTMLMYMLGKSISQK